jgi:Domain of unknown function (DUF4173)
MLVVPLLLLTRAMLKPGAELARRHTMLSLPIIALLGAIILSAALRMRLYVHYYGLTVDRFNTLVFMGWLGFVLLLFAATVLRERGRAFAAGSVVSGLLTLAGLHLVVPDVVVARVNIDRAAPAAAPGDSGLDLRHLTRLSGETADLAVAATLTRPLPAEGSATRAAALDERCEAAENLLRRWGPGSRIATEREQIGAWRIWNAGEANALAVIGDNAAALRRMQHETCGPTYRARREAAAARAANVN